MVCCSRETKAVRYKGNNYSYLSITQVQPHGFVPLFCVFCLKLSCMKVCAGNVTYQLRVWASSPPSFNLRNASTSHKSSSQTLDSTDLIIRPKQSWTGNTEKMGVWNATLGTWWNPMASQWVTASPWYFQCFWSSGDQTHAIARKTKQVSDHWKQLCLFPVPSTQPANVCTSLGRVSTLEDLLYLHPLLQPWAEGWSWSNHSWKRQKQHMLNQHFSWCIPKLQGEVS